jgi:type IV pilus biogenesis protein CpaD/CtpE
MSRSKLIAAIAIVVMAALPSLGCSTMKWLFDDWIDEELGYAYHENVQRQIANPEVVNAESELSGPMDGATAEQVVNGYRTRQDQPPTQRGPSIINIGTGDSQ